MIKIDKISKAYDKVLAVCDLSLEINDGEFFGLLGLNGAGKTTTIGMLSTLLLPSSGTITIDGEILSRSKKEVKRKIAVVTQEYSMKQDMTMDEVMEYQGRLYFMPVKEIRRRSDELFEFTGLTKDRFKIVRQLSGGMKRKLMVCRALLTNPSILLLDEPTAGMDAVSRRQMWQLLRELNAKGLTIVLTTHYMEEAQSLCDRVSFIDNGHIINTDSPDGFMKKYNKENLEDVFVELVGKKSPERLV